MRMGERLPGLENKKNLIIFSDGVTLSLNQIECLTTLNGFLLCFVMKREAQNRRIGKHNFDLNIAIKMNDIIR